MNLFASAGTTPQRCILCSYRCPLTVVWTKEVWRILCEISTLQIKQNRSWLSSQQFFHSNWTQVFFTVRRFGESYVLAGTTPQGCIFLCGYHCPLTVVWNKKVWWILQDFFPTKALLLFYLFSLITCRISAKIVYQPDSHPHTQSWAQAPMAFAFSLTTAPSNQNYSQSLLVGVFQDWTCAKLYDANRTDEDKCEVSCWTEQW